MRLISHRGNTEGKCLMENMPSLAEFAMYLGFEVELDFWYTKGNFYTGHDEPIYKVEEEWLLKYKDELWCHGKNVLALQRLHKLGLNTFAHMEDPFVVTTHGHVISHPYANWKPDTIVMLPERSKSKQGLKKAMGVCSDHIAYYREYYSGKNI